VKVTSRERIAVITGIVALAAVVIFYAAVRLVPDTVTLTHDVDLKKKMLRNQLETLTREDAYKTRLSQCRRQLDQDLMQFLPGENPTLAGADLQKILKDLADQSGVEITQRNTLPEKKVYDFVAKVSVRIETNCTPEQLVQFLSAVESHEKFLKVDEVVINSLKIAKKYEIRPSLTISGLIRIPEEKPKEKAESESGKARV
jgi:hypothetical protein